MEDGLGALMDQSRQLLHWLDGTHLIVGQHHRDQDGVGSERGREVLAPHPPGAVDGKNRELAAELLEVPRGLQDRLVLDRGHYEVAPLLDGPAAAAPQSQVVGFAAATGEDDLPRTGVEHPGEPISSGVHERPRCPTDAVNAGRVAEALDQRRSHRLQHLGSDRRGGGVVEVDGRREQPEARGVSRPLSPGAGR